MGVAIVAPPSTTARTLTNCPAYLREPQFLTSPRRYWLDAPKEEPHTCFVKDSDYGELRAITTRLQLERDQYRNESARLRKALEKIAHPEQGLRPQDKEPFLKGFVPLDRRIALEALNPEKSNG